jgi:hypothetical protein
MSATIATMTAQRSALRRGALAAAVLSVTAVLLFA